MCAGRFNLSGYRGVCVFVFVSSRICSEEDDEEEVEGGGGVAGSTG